jgi:hypothetical protein
MAYPQTQLRLPKQALSASLRSSTPTFRKSSIGSTSTAIGTIAGVTGATMAGDGTIAGGATTAGDRMAGAAAGAGVQGGGIGIMIGIVTVGIAGTGTEFLGPRVAALCIFGRP